MISTEVAGRLLMISAERVRQLIKSDYIARGAGGKIALVAAVQGYIKFLKDDDRRSSKSASDSRVRDARAAEIELRVAERRRKLIEMDEAIAAADRIVAVVRAEIVGLPARATRDMDARRHIENNEAILVTAAGSLPIRAGKQFTASRKFGKTHQNVLVFVKGDAKVAAAAVGDVEFGEIEAED